MNGAPPSYDSATSGMRICNNKENKENTKRASDQSKDCPPTYGSIYGGNRTASRRVTNIIPATDNQEARRDFQNRLNGNKSGTLGGIKTGLKGFAKAFQDLHS